MVAKQPTAEELELANRLLLNKNVWNAYNNNPQTQVAQSLMKAGSNTAAAPGGFAEGLSRVASGLAGGFFGKKAYREAKATEDAAQAYKEEGMRDQIQNAVTPPPAPVPSLALDTGTQAAINATASGQPVGLAGPTPQQPPPPPGPAVVANAMTPQPGAPQAPVMPQNPTPAPVMPGVAVASTTPFGGSPAQSGSRAQRRQQSRSSFDSIYEGFVAPAEGGYNARDPNTGQGVNFGIDQRANPDIDVKNLTRSQAKQVMYDRYWKPSGADTLSPAMQAVYFDTYVLNPSKAKEFLAKSNGDPAAFMQMRRQFLSSINGPHKGWENRNQKLEQFVGLQGGAQSNMAPTGDINVPQPTYEAEAPLPDEPAAVERPTLGDRVRSTRLGIVNRLLQSDMGVGGGIRGMVQDEFLDKGLDEDQAAKLQRDENESQLTNVGYQADLNLRNQKSSDRYSAQVGQYTDTRAGNRQARRDAYQATVDAARDAQQNQYQTARDSQQHRWETEDATTAYNRNWALAEQQLRGKKVTEQDKRQARQDAWLGTKQGQDAQKLASEGTMQAANMESFINQFENAAKNAPSGGAMAIPGVGGVISAVSGNENIGAANNASQGMASMLGEQLKGSMSDSDRAWLQRAVPSLSNDTKVNSGAIKAMRAAVQRQRDYWSNYNKALGDGGAQGINDFQNKWNQYLATVSLNPNVTKNYVTFDQWANRKVIR